MATGGGRKNSKTLKQPPSEKYKLRVGSSKGMASIRARVFSIKVER